MGKRFTATEKWDKEWFMRLSCKHKCLWIYINDKCDQAGMWEGNFTVASMYVGEKIDRSDLIVFGTKIEPFEDKFWVVGHVDFQSGTLSEKSPAHKPIFKLLKKYNLLDRVLGRVSNTLQEKEQEKEKEKDMEEEKEKESRDEIEKGILHDARFLESIRELSKGHDLEKMWNECWIFHFNKPNPPTEVWQWRQKLQTWLNVKSSNTKTNVSAKKVLTIDDLK